MEPMKNTPIGLFGCPLGLLGLTLATLRIEASNGVAHVAGGALLLLTIVLFLLVSMAYATKAVCRPALVRGDWNHPVRCNFFAIISGTLALTVGTLTFAEASGIEGFAYFGRVLYVSLIAIVLVVVWRTVKALRAGWVFVPDS